MNFSRSDNFNRLVQFTILRDAGHKVKTEYRKAYWATLNEQVKCKSPFVPTAEHNQLMLDVAEEIKRTT